MPTPASGPSRLHWSIVLVEPEIPENIGFAARTMACFGVTDLRIVGMGEKISPRAHKTAAGNAGLIESARRGTRLQDLLDDCHLAIAFTRRPRLPAQNLPEIEILLRDLDFPGRLRQGASGGDLRVALIFGRESRGLSREESLQATHLACIEMVAPGMSLNLSHAVAIALREVQRQGLLQAVGQVAPGVEPQPRLEKREEIYADLIGFLEQKGFLKDGNRGRNLTHLRLLWQRLNPGFRELEFLRGLVRKSLAP